MTITLYYFAPSPPARAALLAVRNVGVDVNIKEIDLFRKEQLNEDFVKVNPQHTIPTLDDNGFVLWESRAIAGYLVRQYAENDSLYPRNPQLKALVDQRLYFDVATLYPRVRAIAHPAIYLGERTVSEEKKNNVNEALAWLEKFLHGRKWLAGDSVTIADLSIYATISGVVAFGWDILPFANLTKWLKQCRTLPGADENEAGAKRYGDVVKSKLDEGQI